MSIKSFVIGLAALSVVSAAPVAQWDDTHAPAIVGGVPAVAGDFPFIVSLQKNGAHFCGGSLLDSKTVLTAAHCADGQSTTNLTIRAGSLNRTSGGVTSKVSSLHVHPDFDYDLLSYDVAILKLHTAIPQSSTIKYATLAAAGSEPAANTVATVAGWGTTLSSGSSLPVALLKVDVPIVSRAECAADYLKDSPPKNVTDTMICAALDTGGKDSCQGDSGGPLVNASNGTLIGTVSWGTGCALAGFPGVYAHIGALRSYIDKF
ncbi:Trypsin [Ascochyta rabiei]|uniref:Serine-type endopeptidase n=1 Tax=Didymella rabiei TaxID=5454 RepID=A0A162YDB5_DIDRA|nr:Trypsin [Ascochyta rabiei]KZM19972.1 serine-type endopeptidase [Ascochyta rabiei]UPX12794.1 Trypsin [Ascochyta rabiei]